MNINSFKIELLSTTAISFAPIESTVSSSAHYQTTSSSSPSPYYHPQQQQQQLTHTTATNTAFQQFQQQQQYQRQSLHNFLLAPTSLSTLPSTSVVSHNTPSGNTLNSCSSLTAQIQTIQQEQQQQHLLQEQTHITHMKLLGSNDDRQVRGGVDQSVPRTQDDVAAAAAAAAGYVFSRPSPGGVQPGVGNSGGSIHDVAAAEYAAQFAQKQARWACGDEHTIDVSI